MKDVVIFHLFLSYCYIVSFTYFEAKAFPQIKSNDKAKEAKGVTNDIAKEVVVTEKTDYNEDSTVTFTNLPNNRFSHE